MRQYYYEAECTDGDFAAEGFDSRRSSLFVSRTKFFLAEMIEVVPHISEPWKGSILRTS